MNMIRALLINLLPPWCGIVAGLVAAWLVIVPLVDLALGPCVWEQGCGPNQDLKLVGVLAAACGLGLILGKLTAALVRMLLVRLSA